MTFIACSDISQAFSLFFQCSRCHDLVQFNSSPVYTGTSVFTIPDQIAYAEAASSITYDRMSMMWDLAGKVLSFFLSYMQK